MSPICNRIRSAIEKGFSTFMTCKCVLVMVSIRVLRGVISLLMHMCNFNSDLQDTVIVSRGY